MLRVLIADDEKNVRDGLKMIMDWEEYGFEVCGEACDGNDAYDKIKELKPDLVLMDINMPGIYGIDVIKRLREEGYEGKFIIISGYSDFKYAKSAIKYGVNSYILKPIDEDELAQQIKETADGIHRERVKEKSISESREFLKKDFINKLIHSRDIEENEMLNFKDDFTFDKFQIALIYISSYKDNSAEEITKEIQKYLSSKNDVDIEYIDKYILVLFKGFSLNNVQQRLKSSLAQIKKITNAETFIAQGKTVSSLKNLSVSYEDAKDIMSKKFIFLNKQIVSRSIIKKIIEEKDKEDYSDIMVENLCSYIEIDDMDKMRLCMDKIKKDIIIQNIDEQKIKTKCIRTIFSIRAKLKSTYDLNYDDMISEEEILENLYTKNSLHDTMEYVIENFEQLADKVSSSSGDSTMKKLINYINKNYSMDLKLETLADIFNYNSAYLGKAFKNYAGENFNTYLDKIRIEAAKKLLENDSYKVYQVSEKVGYKNIDYFHGKFRKYVGTSPLNYKKQLSQQDKEAVR